MMLGSYSYLHGNERRSAYTTTDTTSWRGKTHYFTLMPLDEDIAVMRFFTDERFVEPEPVPSEFRLTARKAARGEPSRAASFSTGRAPTTIYATPAHSLRTSQQRWNEISMQNGAVILSCP
jgi:hypothetical protein